VAAWNAQLEQDLAETAKQERLVQEEKEARVELLDVPCATRSEKLLLLDMLTRHPH
jgi:hypothetical protein